LPPWRTPAKISAPGSFNATPLLPTTPRPALHHVASLQTSQAPAARGHRAFQEQELGKNLPTAALHSGTTSLCLSASPELRWVNSCCRPSTTAPSGNSYTVWRTLLSSANPWQELGDGHQYTTIVRVSSIPPALTIRHYRPFEVFALVCQRLNDGLQFSKEPIFYSF